MYYSLINYHMFRYVICDIQNEKNLLYYEDINKLFKSKIVSRPFSDTNYTNFINTAHNTISINSNKLNHLYQYFMSAMCQKICHCVYLNSSFSNKIQYKQYKTCLSDLLISTNHDTVSGWSMLASFFYKEKQYKKSLTIIPYALS